MIRKIKDFMNGVQFEMKKVSWPTWDELRGSTMVVLGLSLILGIFLFVVDFLLSRVVNVVL
ncbi:MAG TPA: preprotein translocase subunit SecE [Candidatus Marinimicrobia bacterium]|nr:preprotein translocase subunit SecE [Candidatus Neomarinimicrobiota bacterium]HHZ98090.1 preprotein translocase subunit SecE [Candidatus Neomarinimicrobiota bacterium]HIB02401.1 preprotein translocase subunit SecE [Candidatus Neomarinimicrobiota bacterium]HIB70689.1 preprotein translocase subunit SecE [Candidatus Neomarinimicrobiota bacterium]HIB96769.1 preprotein translocase subunit SecE [Candidatus Neomarinimicrobiota bacterium]